MPELVSPYEEREACRFSNYNWATWEDLPVEERATCVAHYRLNRLIQAHQQDAISREVERRNREREQRRGS